MATSDGKIKDLTQKTTSIIGRKAEIERLNDYLHARGESNVLYYWAHGGLGKTRLLEEVDRLVGAAGEGYYSSGIIDLYHTDTHSSSDIERAIVDALDPDNKYFSAYRAERKQFERLRELGAEPRTLEKRREKLSELFVMAGIRMAVDARKLVLLFDTIELLQYESSVVEEAVGLASVDTRIRHWLLDKLPRLANIMIVFAGRPKPHNQGETVDHQARLEKDMADAFGESLEVIELPALNMEETREMISALSRQQTVIPPELTPVVHRLTGGRPIFIHLVVDLIQTLAAEPALILAMLAKYQDLENVPAADKNLEAARREIEIELLKAAIYESGEWGEYLNRIAMMPKGFDLEVLQKAFGVPAPEAKVLLENLGKLSFVKQFKPAPGAPRLHGDRYFLHDEMYDLLTRADVARHLRISERQLAQGLVTNYYDPEIKRLERGLADLLPDDRVKQRERIQKLEVERLYYLLVRDPQAGYEAYKALSDQAYRNRWVGFGMRLLDEFLRFYNQDKRRRQFDQAGIPHAQITRESAQLWMNRFHWWGRYKEEVDFAKKIMDDPAFLQIDPQADCAILADIVALWARGWAMLHGFDEQVVETARKIYSQLPDIETSTLQELLARGRLGTSIGYLYRWGGLFKQAEAPYIEAVAAFHKLGQYPDELAIVLNNLAYVYALQGRIPLARIRVQEALAINEKMGSEYSTGLTLTNYAAVERMANNYPAARKYAEDALDIFQELEDAHGIVRSYVNLADSLRGIAKLNMERPRKVEEARRHLETAERFLGQALEVAEGSKLEAEYAEILTEQGKVYRELGQVIMELESLTAAQPHFHSSQRSFDRALALGFPSAVKTGDALEDMAELYYRIKDPIQAANYLQKAERTLQDAYPLDPCPDADRNSIPPEVFWPLGKIEALRAEIAFSQDQAQAGLEHYVLAYAYFLRFSADALQKDRMLASLYSNLRTLPLSQQKDLFSSLQEWVRKNQDCKIKVDISSLMQILGTLIGV